MESSTTSAAEVKGSEWAEGGEEEDKKQKERRNREIMVERKVRKVKKRS